MKIHKDHEFQTTASHINRYPQFHELSETLQNNTTMKSQTKTEDCKLETSY